MATKRMLIDATHPEETRVVVISGNRLEDFDVEVQSRKQLKGNIYLAKVTRVEPSLQAAFVEYGGNRHGFLAFSEIHPDYYQIPVADREALMADSGDDAEEPHEDAEGADAGSADSETADAQAADADMVEELGGDDAAEEAEARRPYRSYRHYKIQEVIKRRQILLIQVVKEERGNKGAALTTYLSLAGRYCVLMPNTTKAGGISRKIASAADRKRLKSVLSDMEIPDGMAVIVRTAGAQRSKAEIRRDYDYLLRQWDTIRQQTLESSAPCLIYEEANLIKRAIRDLYDKGIEEVIVEGDEGYRIAKDFMKMLIPSHAKKVQPYRDPTVPLLHRFQVESQLDAMHGPGVQLKSGGYIVINPTEALVSIDVNSGRSTRERNIEETAYRTNLEAADEIARQLRLRDLAGLIVIDFIDMETQRYQTAVERRVKEAMRVDRARIQIGRISPFGLLELSRQRLRPSLIETSFGSCPHCGGTGVIRSTESTALHILRSVEEEGLRGRSAEVAVHLATSVALYILNQKRQALADIEARYGFSVLMHGDDSLVPPDHRIERLRAKTAEEIAARPVVRPLEIEPAAETEVEDGADETDDQGRRKKRRRRRRKRPDGAEETAETLEVGDADEPADAAADAEAEGDGDGDDETPRKRRRRGKRGGRRRRRADAEADGNDKATESTDTEAVEDGDVDASPRDGDAEAPEDDGSGDEATADPSESEQPQALLAWDDGANETVAPPAETGAEWDVPEPLGNTAPPVETGAEWDVPEPPGNTAPPVEASAEWGTAEPIEESEPPEAVDPISDPAPESGGGAATNAEPRVPAGTEVIDVDSVTTDRPKRGWWSRIGG